MPKNTTQCPWPGLEPGPLAPGTSTLRIIENNILILEIDYETHKKIAFGKIPSSVVFQEILKMFIARNLLALR